MIRSENKQLVKCWLPLVIEYLKYFGIDEKIEEEIITLVYSMMDKIEYDFTKMAGICLWSLLYEVKKVKFEDNELHMFVSMFNSKEEVIYILET